MLIGILCACGVVGLPSRVGVFGTRGDRGVASTRAGSSAVWAGVLVGWGSSCRLYVVEPWVALPPFRSQ